MKIKPQLLDLVMRDDDFVIYQGNSPLLTPAGNEMAQVSSRILKQILLELSLSETRDLTSVNAFSLFSFQLDAIEKGTDPFLHNFDSLAAMDPFIQLKEGNKKQSQLFDPEKINLLLEQHSSLFNLVYWGMSGLLETFTGFLLKAVTDDSRKPGTPEPSVTSVLRNIYVNLENSEKTAVNFLSYGHRTGVVLPILLAGQYINASEYTNGFFTIRLQIPEDEIFLDDRENLMQPYIRISAGFSGFSDPFGAFGTCFREAGNVVEYLVCSSAIRKSGITEVIERGESNDLEFKSTLRWDIRAGKTSQMIERAVLKSVSAFLNSGGGTLLIGVRDDGTIEGIETDRLPNEDKFLLHFWTLVRTAFGRDVSPYLKVMIERIEGKGVCVVRCFRSPRPVFLKQPGFEEEFYIRVGPSSTALAVSEALKYIADHFAEK